ncbi:MAG: EAL domain-containing protein [Sulfuricurvum sp.]|nr:EAL domain-containing protein [Sulfuricurvum sp.]
MGAASIAENVESAEIFAQLKELNIDYAQGFYIGKPSPCC